MKTATGNSYRAIKTRHMHLQMLTKYPFRIFVWTGDFSPVRRPVKQLLYCTNPNRKNNQLNSFVGY